MRGIVQRFTKRVFFGLIPWGAMIIIGFVASWQALGTLRPRPQLPVEGTSGKPSHPAPHASGLSEPSRPMVSREQVRMMVPASDRANMMVESRRFHATGWGRDGRIRRPFGTIALGRASR